jgi:hypothetical protein
MWPGHGDLQFRLPIGPSLPVRSPLALPSNNDQKDGKDNGSKGQRKARVKENVETRKENR